MMPPRKETSFRTLQFKFTLPITGLLPMTYLLDFYFKIGFLKRRPAS